MRLVLALLGLLASAPAWAEEVWVLQSGPEATDSIPLSPLQPVPAWKALYTEGTARLWVYATTSPYFFAPTIPEVRRVGGTNWTVAVFFPKDWKVDRRTAWLDSWVASFVVLASLPSPGWPVLFPSVLRKG